MAFDDLSLRDLLDRELDLTGNLININAELKGSITEPIEITIDLSPRQTRRGKRLPPHRKTIKLKSPDDFEDAWDEVVKSFKNRFAKRKQWYTEDGHAISPKQHRQRAEGGIMTDRLDVVDRWNDRAWNAIMVGLEPSQSDIDKIKRLDFGDFKRIEEIQEVKRTERNELARVKHEIRKRQLHKMRMDSWKPKVTDDYAEDELRKKSQRWLYARFGIKNADMDYVRRFKKGEIGLDEIHERVKSYVNTK